MFETSNAADDCYKILNFTTNDTKKCHNYSIENNDVCESMRVLTVGLSVTATIGSRAQQDSQLSRTTVFIDDSREPECCKYVASSQFPKGSRIIHKHYQTHFS